MKKYLVIGLMSGTSLDGLDIALVSFEYSDGWKYAVLKSLAIPYDDKMRNSLSEAIDLTGLGLKKLDVWYGEWLGHQVNDFLMGVEKQPELIVSHGHTIFHQPEIGITKQIGDGYKIMTTTGIRTVSDLRSLDVALGGQGAPLVPVGDKLLFEKYTFCLNLGGFSNISYDVLDRRLAYDICPVNTVLNHLARKIGLEYDDGGTIALTGKLIPILFNALNNLSYYTLPPPKSLGIEWVNTNIMPLLQDQPIPDLLHTFCLHIARQIALSINSSDVDGGSKNELLVTGGGARNRYLIDLIRSELGPGYTVVVPDDQTVDFKEAIIFAFLGLLRSLGQVNTLKAVTGASVDSSGGMIFDPSCFS